MGSSNGGASTSSPRVSPNAILKIQDPAGFVLSPTDNETRNMYLSPEGLPHQSPQSDGRLTLPPMVIEGWDSGVSERDSEEKGIAYEAYVVLV